MSLSRASYRPGGRVDPVRFVPAGAVVTAAAAGAGWLLWRGFEGGVYGPLIFPLAAAMLVGVLGNLAVQLGRCRSQLAAVALGVVGSFCVMPGPHLLAWRLAEPAGEASPGSAVRFVDARFASRDVHWGLHPAVLAADDPDAEPTPADRLTLWVCAGLELVLVPMLAALPLLLRVRRTPYCEACGRWTERRRLGFAAGSDALLRRGLDQGDLVRVAAAVVEGIHPNRPAVIGHLDSCPGPLCHGAPGFLSLHVTRGEAAAAQAMETLFPFHRVRPRCAELTAEEVRGLRALVPDPQRAAGTTMVLPSFAEDAFAELEGEEPDPTRPPAAVTEVSQGHPPPAADRRTRALAEWLDLALLVGGGATTGVLIWAGSALRLEERFPTAGLAVAALTPLLVGLGLMLRDRHLLSNRLLLRRLARRVAARAQPLLSPDDGDVLPVALVPRAVWAGQAGNDAIDHGYLAVRGGELLYEGDRWRIRAPRGAVMAAQVEPLVVDRHYTVFFVQAIVRGPDLPFELPFVRIGCPLGELIVRGGKRRSAVLLDRLLPAVTEGSAASGGVELAVSLPPLGSP